MPQMGVDIETSGYYTFYTEVCLIQISAGGFHYVIDSLVGLDLSALGELFADKATIKIFHGASSDLAELKRGTNWHFENIFDTLQCCRMLVHDSCSLASLTAHYFQAPMEKKEQKSNWKQRPLTRSQLEYAHTDTIHLEALRERLLAELPDALLPELYSEFEWISRSAHAREKEADPLRWTKIPGAVDLPPDARGFLAALVQIRDERAAKENIAAFRLVTNESLLKLARRMPKTLAELKQSGLLNPRLLRKDGERIVEAALSVVPIKDEDIPQPPDVSPETLERTRRLKKWRKAMSEFRGMDSSLIVSNRVFDEICKHLPEDVTALAALDLMSDWKVQNYGADLVRILREPYGGKMNREVPRLQIEQSV